MYPTISSDESISRNPLLRHTKVRRAMGYKLVCLFKRALIQEEINSLTRRKLSRLPLTLPPFRPATLFGNGVARLKLCKLMQMAVGLGCGNGLRNERFGGGHRTRF